VSDFYSRVVLDPNTRAKDGYPETVPSRLLYRIRVRSHIAAQSSVFYADCDFPPSRIMELFTILLHTVLIRMETQATTVIYEYHSHCKQLDTQYRRIVSCQTRSCPTWGFRPKTCKMLNKRRCSMAITMCISSKETCWRLQYYEEVESKSICSASSVSPYVLLVSSDLRECIGTAPGNPHRSLTPRLISTSRLSHKLCATTTGK
jgi:hypothetical protein